ncbi:MAG: hypothetical protein A4E42_00898 [Methanoregulaceae archaeon PtaU1.Bin222]|nr:MAG: hypothetical protein A4E42_00898 [Methanoregulaceae archaeon PtaU1.Bin222]
MDGLPCGGRHCMIRVLKTRMRRLASGPTHENAGGIFIAKKNLCLLQQRVVVLNDLPVPEPDDPVEVLLVPVLV